MRRIAAFGAVFGVFAACMSLAAAAPALARPRALIAFIPTQPAPKMPLLFDLAERDFSYGVTSPTLGAYNKFQMLLDVSQGSRIANNAYPRNRNRLDLLETGGDSGRIVRFGLAAERAKDAPGDVVPGLLASTVQAAGGRVAYAGVVGLQQAEATVAADETGHVQ